MIEGVYVKKLVKRVDERGWLMEMLRSDDSFFEQFGQCYVTVCNPGYVKGWHYHNKQRDNFSVIKGTAKIVLYDQREDSKTKGEVNEFIVGEDNPQLISIPIGVFHGFECQGNESCYIVNCPTEMYNREKPDEFRIDPFDNDIPYKWTAEKGG